MSESFVPGSTVTILPGMNSGVGILTPLIPFNMIVDSDVGLLTMIYRDYPDDEVFNMSYYKNKTRTGMVLDLYTRREENPLSLIIRDDYRDEMEDLYNQFMEQKYDTILDMSVITEFYRLIGRFEVDPDIKVMISCEREEEVKALRTLDNTKNSAIIMGDDIDPGFIKGREQFYFKCLADAIPYAKHMDKKSVYFSAYGFNLKEEGGFIDHPIIPLLIRRNSIYVIDVFNRNKLEGKD